MRLCGLQRIHVDLAHGFLFSSAFQLLLQSINLQLLLAQFILQPVEDLLHALGDRSLRRFPFGVGPILMGLLSRIGHRKNLSCKGKLMSIRDPTE